VLFLPNLFTMKYKTFFVDFGGVLVLNRARMIGEHFERIYGLTHHDTMDVFGYLHSGERTETEIDIFLEDHKIKKEIWQQYLGEMFCSESRNENLISILERAKEGGIKIIFTTNNSSDFLRIMQKYELENLPHAVVNSSLSGFAKPDPLFWEFAFGEAEKLSAGIQKGEILVVDDSYENIESAIAFGLDAIVYDGENADRKIEGFFL